MKGWLRFAVFSISVMFAVCGIKDVHVHFEQLRGAQSPQPRGLQGNRSLNFSPEFHKENTVTNVLSAEEEEDDDYLDFEKLLSEDDDYSDVIDAVPETVSDFKWGSVAELFHGKTRIQRLNLFNANFAFDLYRSMKEKANATENILLAPVGISTAMAMVSLGLRGETREEVLNSLGFTEFTNASSKYDAMTIHNVFHKLIHRLFRRNFGYTLRSVNDLYIEKKFPVPSEFKNDMKNYYFAESQLADFADPKFIAKANERILKITKGLIKEALVHVHPATVMMILNCLYFKGK